MRILFLLSDKVVETDVPDSFDALPHLRVGLRLNRGGPRHLSFFPSSRFEHPRTLDDMHQVDTGKDANGQAVTIFEQNADPAVWIAVWDFDNGHATAAFNPNDRGDLPGFLRSVSFDTSGGGAPRVKLGSALSVGDTRRPVFRDIAMYLATLPDGTWQSLQFSDMPSDKVRDPVPDASDRPTGAAMQITYAGGVKIMLSAGPSYADDVVRDFAQVTSALSVA